MGVGSPQSKKDKSLIRRNDEISESARTQHCLNSTNLELTNRNHVQVSAAISRIDPVILSSISRLVDSVRTNLSMHMIVIFYSNAGALK